MVDIQTIKAQIRSVLLSLGKTATEQEFRKAYYEVEGESFNVVLRQLNTNFNDLFLRIPDVAKIVYEYNQVFIQRISNEATAHMENLTIQKYSKNYRGPKLVTKNGAIKGANTSYRPQTSSERSTSTSYNKPQTLQMPTRSKQAFDFGNISNTSTKKDLSINEPANSLEFLRSSSVVSFFSNFSKTSRMVPAPPSDISSISSSDSTIDDNFKDATFDQRSAKIEYNRVLHETIKPSKRILTESPMIAPMASTTRPALNPQESPKLDASIAKSRVTSLLKSSKPKEAKNLSKLDSLVDKVETLKLDDKRNSQAQHLNPNIIRRLRSMRIFQEALNDVNTNLDVSSQSTVSLFDPKVIITLPEPTLVEEETFFFMKIIDIESPGKFVFQFSFEKLKNLSTKMNDFYNSIKDIEKYKINDLDVDNIVAIRYNDLWYRGQIKSFDGTEANIQLVDVMKIQTRKVLYRNIFRLDQKFAIDSPKSAFGKLHGLKPLDGEWSMLSKVKMNLFQEKILLATVRCIDNGVYSLSIINKTRNFQRVSDMIIEENLAGINMDDFATEPVFRSLV